MKYQLFTYLPQLYDAPDHIGRPARYYTLRLPASGALDYLKVNLNWYIYIMWKSGGPYGGISSTSCRTRSIKSEREIVYKKMIEKQPKWGRLWNGPVDLCYLSGSRGCNSEWYRSSFPCTWDYTWPQIVNPVPLCKKPKGNSSRRQKKHTKASANSVQKRAHVGHTC